MSATDDTRCRQLERVLRLARRLQGQSMTPDLAVLAKDYAVCIRTVRRDLRLLERAGWPVPPRRRWSPTADDRHAPRGVIAHLGVRRRLA